MPVKIRFNEPTRIVDLETRSYLNELVRTLNSCLEGVVLEEDVFGFVEDIIVAGTSITASANQTTETITISKI